MDLLRGEGDRFVVVDVETTGVLNRDRVVEVAAVTLSPSGRIVDEWDTLVNPQRDVGPTHLHKVSASMVSAAPTFAEVAAALAERLCGAVLVAHNLPFDSRMLVNEYSRAGGNLAPGEGVCTLRLTREKLEVACRRRSIPFEYPHRALADARATARLLRTSTDDLNGGFSTAFVDIPAAKFRPRTLRRDVSQEADEEMPYLARLADRAHHYGEHGAELVYMDMLDWAISDLVLTRTERAQLMELAIDLGLSADEVAETHQRYLDELIEAALRDGVVDDNELHLLSTAAEQLGVDADVVASRIEGHERDDESVALRPDMRVCFTGAATTSEGDPLTRAELEEFAVEHGLVPVKGVGKKGCDLLVAADPTSQSGKARKARQYGIPVASVDEFWSATPGAAIAVS